MSHPGFSADLTAVFPDWSPYPDLESAARAYLRDPDLALYALAGVLGGGSVLTFTLERFVNETNGVWQEVAACDGARLVLWHGEDIPPGEGPTGGMTSSIRDALRFVKTIEDGGPGQIARLEDFALTVSALVGRPL